jgi:quercetin dioxygenase-like cupin family protein
MQPERMEFPANPGRSSTQAAVSFDLSQVYVHLGLGARAETLPDFTWSEEYLRRYEADHEADGDEGRLVMIGPEEATWTSWERHPAGDEVVVALSGHQTLIQDLDGKQHRIELRAGQAVINPRGIWHTADVHEPGSVLFITPGRGTEHRPR